jgi:hypothetical protein
MKRLVCLLIILLSAIFIAHAESERAGLSTATVSASQKEISVKLDELEARAAELQAKLNVSHEILKKRGQL